MVRRLDGLLQGGHRGRIVGPGSEPGEGARIEPGDDVRRIDWNLTARTDRPDVRDVVADRELETWIVVDRSPSLDFGTAASEARSRGRGAAAASASSRPAPATASAGSCSGAARRRRCPPRVGRRARPRAARPFQLSTIAPSPTRRRRAAALGDVLVRSRAVPADAGLVVVISDFLDPADAASGWARPLRALRETHRCDRGRDRRPDRARVPRRRASRCSRTPSRCAAGGGDRAPGVRERYEASAAAAFRADVRDTLRHAAAHHVVLRTDSDWVLDLARYLRRRRRTAWLAHATKTLAIRRSCSSRRRCSRSWP